MGIFGRNKKALAKEEEPSPSRVALAQAAAMSAEQSRTTRQWQPPPMKFVELGTIDYVNLTGDGRHGDFKTAMEIAAETGKPIFANFVEWSG